MGYATVPSHSPGDTLPSADWMVIANNLNNGGVMRMLADTTLLIDAASIDFTSIPATFAHLMLVVYAKSAAAAATDALNLRINGDAGANYNFQQLIGAAAVASASTGAAQTQGACTIIPGSTGPAATEFGQATIFLAHYAQTTNRKTWASFGGQYASSPDIRLIVGQDSSIVAAVNRLTFFATSGNLKAGSRATLYGLPL